MKKFHLKIEQGKNRLSSKDKEIEIPNIKNPALPALRSRSLQRPRYKAFPNTAARRALDPEPSISAYQQHRAQDIGRAIATGKYIREEFIGQTSPGIWEFREEIHPSGEEPYWKYYTVTWNGLLTPTGGLSNTRYSQGFSYYRQDDGATITVPGRPCKFTWAVKFMVEGIPPDNLWPPLPSKWALYPYNSIEPWVEYPL